jgi:hypothetical protein
MTGLFGRVSENTHYITVKEVLAYTSGVHQDPVLDFSDAFWPEEEVDSQPDEEEQEEEVAVDPGGEENVALQKCGHEEPPYNEASEWPAVPRVFSLVGTGDESNNRAVPEVE